MHALAEPLGSWPMCFSPASVILFTCRFPDCECERALAYTPTRLLLLNSSSDALGNNVYCFAFDLVSVLPDPDSDCASADLEKFEIPVRECL